MKNVETLLNNEDFQNLLKKLEAEGLTFKFENDKNNPHILGYMYTADDVKKYAICTEIPMPPEPPLWNEQEQMRKLEEYIDKLDQDYTKSVSSFDERPFYHRFENNRHKKKR